MDAAFELRGYRFNRDEDLTVQQRGKRSAGKSSASHIPFPRFINLRRAALNQQLTGE